MQAEKRRPGRPAREPSPGERVGLSLRVTPATKRALDKGSEDSGRSLSQEAEYRLDQALFMERVLGEWRAPHLWYGVAGSAEAAAQRIADERGVSGDWSGNPDCFAIALLHATESLLDKWPGPWDGQLLHMILDQALVSAQHRRVPDWPGKTGRQPTNEEAAP